MMLDWNKNKWFFKDIHSFGYPYFHVHPYKQKVAKHLVENIPNWVTNVIIFGSSVRLNHLWFKDLDVCIIGTCDSEKNLENYRDSLKMANIDYDFIEYTNFDQFLAKTSLFGEIAWRVQKEGVMLYEK
ncbi:MAG: nucleotidyltransferase domain-containing protein [Defluviitaleaceae bacterium]|nr:nucleotidyltransferase domain-containing protein [Defluviitaleaceae bacterium]